MYRNMIIKKKKSDIEFVIYYCLGSGVWLVVCSFWGVGCFRKEVWLLGDGRVFG